MPPQASASPAGSATTSAGSAAIERARTRARGDRVCFGKRIGTSLGDVRRRRVTGLERMHATQVPTCAVILLRARRPRTGLALTYIQLHFVTLSYSVCIS